MYEVKFDPLGFAIIRVYIRPAQGAVMAHAQYKVDSGASCTTISREELAKLGYDEGWIRSGKPLLGANAPTLASGASVKNCYEVVLPEIHIGEWVGYNWPVLTSLSVPFKFLLGTDSMQFFNWHFDYENNVCKFSLIEGKRKLLFNQKEQSIHALDETERKQDVFQPSNIFNTL